MKKLSIISGLLLLALTVNAQSIMLSSAGKGIAKTNDQFTGFNVTFSYDQIESVTITETERGTFSAITIEGAYIDGEYGMPGLPIFKKMISIPEDATPKVVIKSYSTNEYRLEDYGIHTIFPRQPDVRKDWDPSTIPFEYDEKAYSMFDYNYSNIAEVEVIGKMRGLNIGMLAVRPIQYNPSNNTIRVYNDIEVEVIFENGDYTKTYDLFKNTFSPYFLKTYNTMFNTGVQRDVYDDNPDLYKTPVHMLVISHRMFETTLQPWIAWKTKKGFYMDVNYTDDIGTTSAAIKTFCHNKYNQGITNGTAPTFIVIVGDTPQVPASQTGSLSAKATDFYYAAIDADYFPEMYYSRMSATTVQQLQNIIEKTLYYEQYQFADPTYLDNVLLIAGADATWAPRVGRPQINYAADNYFNTAHGYVNIHKYVTNDYTGCYTHMNNVGFANFTAHCSETLWSDPNFTIANVNALTNVNRYYVAMGNCCLAADFGYGECIGEAMIRAPQKGAVGYIGSSPNSYWGDDFHFTVGAYAGNITVPTNPTPQNTKTGCYDFMFQDEGFNTMCSHVFGGNLSVTYAHVNPGYTVHTSNPRYYWEAYNVLGDGSLMPFLSQASDNTVSHLPTFPIGLGTFEVMAVPGSYVAISKNGILHGVAVADASGVALVTLDPPINEGGDVDIVVTRNQYKPYINQIPAAALTGPYIVSTGYSVIGADVLTYITNNEEIEVTLKNVGIEATSGTLTATITGTDPQLTINTGTAQYTAVINPDGLATVKFKVTVANDIIDGKSFPLDLTVTQPGKDPWISKLVLKAYAPKFSLGKVLINGVEGGSLPKGSLVRITTVIENKGGADAFDVETELEMNDQFVTFACDDKKRLGVDIPTGESESFDFYIITSPDMPYGHVVNFKLLLEAMYGRSFEATFNGSCSGSDNYCMPGSSNCSSYNDRITSLILVKTSDQSVLINNPNPICNSNGYTDYTSTIVNFEPGVQYTVKVKTGYQNHRVKGWIDFNGNNSFEESEALFTIACATVGVEYSANFTIPQDFAPGTHRFRIRTRDGSNVPEACNTYSYGQTLDYSASLPELYPRVQNVVAVLNGNAITTTWDAPAGGSPTGYNIYRDGNKLNIELLTALTFTENNIESGVYAYSVTAVYTDNKESFGEMSNVICHIIPPGHCEEPVDLEGIAEKTTAILTWKKPVNIDGKLLKYNVYRDEVKIGEVMPNILTYQDKDLDYKTYIYKVSASYGHCSESELTDGVPVTIFCDAPVPVNFTGVANQSTATLTWEEPEHIGIVLTGYNIYRDGDKIHEAEITELEYHDENLENRTYIYEISAVYEHCESLFAEVSVTIDYTGICSIPADAFQIFPNPAHSELNIIGKVVPTTVRLYNITGQLVYETDQCAVKMNIPVSEMPIGVYFIRIITESGTVTKKIVKE